MRRRNTREPHSPSASPAYDPPPSHLLRCASTPPHSVVLLSPSATRFGPFGPLYRPLYGARIHEQPRRADAPHCSDVPIQFHHRFFKRAEHSPLCDSDMRRLVVIISVRGAAVWKRINWESRRLQPRGLRSPRCACGSLRAPHARVLLFNYLEITNKKNFASAAGDLPNMTFLGLVISFEIRAPSRFLIVHHWG